MTDPYRESPRTEYLTVECTDHETSISVSINTTTTRLAKEGWRPILMAAGAKPYSRFVYVMFQRGP